jgi:hypothetical protein
VSEPPFRLHDGPSSVHSYALPVEEKWAYNQAPVMQVLLYFVHRSWRNVCPLGYQSVIYGLAKRSPYPSRAASSTV